MVLWPQLGEGGVGHFVVGTTQKYHFFDAAPKVRLHLIFLIRIFSFFGYFKAKENGKSQVGGSFIIFPSFSRYLRFWTPGEILVLASAIQALFTEAGYDNFYVLTLAMLAVRMSHTNSSYKWVLSTKAFYYRRLARPLVLAFYKKMLSWVLVP